MNILKASLLFLFTFFSLVGFAQTQISGTITQKNGTPIVGANIYLEGTYDGASSDDQGRFSFTTDETGIQTLVASFVSFEPMYMAADVSQMKDLKLVLKEDVNSLDTVVISAGSFQAGDNSKVSVLKPLDVVTTASALGDFVGALQTLPGTTTVAEDGRLFVRGGMQGKRKSLSMEYGCSHRTHLPPITFPHAVGTVRFCSTELPSPREGILPSTDKPSLRYCY